MLVPAYRALGWTGSSGPDAVSDPIPTFLELDDCLNFTLVKLSTIFIFHPGKESEGLDAHEAYAEQALATAWNQSQQAEGEHSLQGQKRDVLRNLFTSVTL